MKRFEEKFTIFNKDANGRFEVPFKNIPSRLTDPNRLWKCQIPTTKITNLTFKQKESQDHCGAGHLQFQIYPFDSTFPQSLRHCAVVLWQAGCEGRWATTPIQHARGFNFCRWPRHGYSASLSELYHAS